MSIKIKTFPGRRILVGKKSYLYFGGTAYLGVQTNPEFQSVLIRNIQRYGTNYGASRLSNVQIDMFDEAESGLSGWVGSESCITLSSGYLAGQLLAGFFNTDKYRLFYLSNTHASLYKGFQNSAENFAALKISLTEHLRSGNGKIPVIFTDSIDLEASNYPDYTELQSLPLDSCILIADDSHGIGILGADGEGTYKALRKLRPMELIVCSSLGKSLGLQAGAVFGSKQRINSIKDTPIFSGASPAAISILASLIEALPLYARQRELLLGNIDQFDRSLARPDLFNSISSYPVYQSRNEELADYLYKNGICITHFHYAAENCFESRIVLNAMHISEDIEKITELVNNFHG